MLGQPDRKALSDQQAVKVQSDRLAHKAMLETLALLDHKVCRASKAFKAMSDLLDQLAVQAQLVMLDQQARPDQQAHKETLAQLARLDRLAHREYKAMSAQRDRKAYRVFKAYREMLDLLDRLVRQAQLAQQLIPQLALLCQLALLGTHLWLVLQQDKLQLGTARLG